MGGEHLEIGVVRPRLEGETRLEGDDYEGLADAAPCVDSGRTVCRRGGGGVGWLGDDVGANDKVIVACAKKKSGALRLVASAKNCRKTERVVTWNQEGLRGLPGPKGVAGDDGVDGEDGIDGEDGVDGEDGDGRCRRPRRHRRH